MLEGQTGIETCSWHDFEPRVLLHERSTLQAPYPVKTNKDIDRESIFKTDSGLGDFPATDWTPIDGPREMPKFGFSGIVERSYGAIRYL